MAVDIVGLCVHGLLGNTFSLGMDSLATQLNRATPDGVHFNVEGGDNPAFIGADLTAWALGFAAKGAVIVPIGHSLGADWVWEFCQAAKAANVKVPLAFSVDPVNWTTNGATAGVWEVDDNVQIAMNFRQPYYPGGGYLIHSPGNKTTDIQQNTYNYPHASYGQSLAMDTATDIHGAIITAVVQFIKAGHV